MSRLWYDEAGKAWIVPPWCVKVIGVDEFPFRDCEEWWYDGPVSRCPWPRQIDFQPGVTGADHRNARAHGEAMRRSRYAAALRETGMTYREVGEELGCGARRAAELAKRWQGFLAKGEGQRPGRSARVV